MKWTVHRPSSLFVKPVKRNSKRYQSVITRTLYSLDTLWQQCLIWFTVAVSIQTSVAACNRLVNRPCHGKAAVLKRNVVSLSGRVLVRSFGTSTAPSAAATATAAAAISPAIMASHASHEPRDPGTFNVNVAPSRFQAIQAVPAVTWPDLWLHRNAALALWRRDDCCSWSRCH